MGGNSLKISASFSVYPAPAGDSPLYSVNCNDSGNKNASRREAVLDGPYPVGSLTSFSSSGRKWNCSNSDLSSRALLATLSATAAIVSETTRTRSSSSGVRKKGRRKGQCTLRPKVSLAIFRSVRNFFANSGDFFTSGRSAASHSSTGPSASVLEALATLIAGESPPGKSTQPVPFVPLL